MSSKSYLSPLCSCIHCREVKSAKGIHSHFHTAHTAEGNLRSVKNGRKSSDNLHYRRLLNVKCSEQKRIEYSKNPHYCLLCESPLPYKKKTNKFCSSRCSATFNNSKRDYSAFKPGPKPTAKLKRKKKDRSKGPFSEVHFKKCFNCSEWRYSKQRIRQKYCKNCIHLYSDHGRVPFYFKFNVYDYPNLFDLDLIKHHGWFSNGKNGKHINISGVSRDHKVSVNEAIKNNYNPYYISHVMNCQLMLHQDNNRKNSNSSITYEELVKLVDEYDKCA